MAFPRHHSRYILRVSQNFVCLGPFLLLIWPPCCLADRRSATYPGNLKINLGKKLWVLLLNLIGWYKLVICCLTDALNSKIVDNNLIFIRPLSGCPKKLLQVWQRYPLSYYYAKYHLDALHITLHGSFFYLLLNLWGVAKQKN